MKGEWVYNEAFYKKEQCDYIIQEALKIKPEEPTIGYEGKRADTDYRRSKIRWILPNNEKLGFLFEAFDYN